MESNNSQNFLYDQHLNDIYKAESPPTANDIIKLEDAIHNLYNYRLNGNCLSSDKDYIKICLDYGHKLSSDYADIYENSNSITSYLFIDCENWGIREKKDLSRIEINIIDLSSDRAIDLKGLKTRIIINRNGLIVENCSYMMRPIIVTKLGELEIQHPPLLEDGIDVSEAYDRSLSKFDIEFLMKLISNQKLQALSDSHKIYSEFM